MASSSLYTAALIHIYQVATDASAMLWTIIGFCIAQCQWIQDPRKEGLLLWCEYVFKSSHCLLSLFVNFRSWSVSQIDLIQSFEWLFLHWLCVHHRFCAACFINQYICFNNNLYIYIERRLSSPQMSNCWKSWITRSLKNKKSITSHK